MPHVPCSQPIIRIFPTPGRLSGEIPDELRKQSYAERKPNVAFGMPGKGTSAPIAAATTTQGTFESGKHSTAIIGLREKPAISAAVTTVTHSIGSIPSRPATPNPKLMPQNTGRRIGCAAKCFDIHRAVRVDTTWNKASTHPAGARGTVHVRDQVLRDSTESVPSNAPFPVFPPSPYPPPLQLPLSCTRGYTTASKFWDTSPEVKLLLPTVPSTDSGILLTESI